MITAQIHYKSLQLQNHQRSKIAHLMMMMMIYFLGCGGVCFSEPTETEKVETESESQQGEKVSEVTADLTLV